MTSNNPQPLVSRKALIINHILTLAVFLLFTYLLRDNVPLSEEQDPIYALAWGGFSAACLSGVFWLACHMFTVVLVDARRRKK